MKLGWLLQGPGNWGDILECSRIVIVIMAIWFTIDYNYGIVYRNPVCFLMFLIQAYVPPGQQKQVDVPSRMV